MASSTEAFSPWISETTAMMDVTATMLPSTVMNDRSLAAQIAASAIIADSKNLFISGQEDQERQERLDRPDTRELCSSARPACPACPARPAYFFVLLLLSTFTVSPSAMPRTELYGPVITCSPSFSPYSTSKYLSPAIPILIGTNSARLSRIRKTPSVSLRVCPGGSSCGEA